jgi:hypothetical protein
MASNETITNKPFIFPPTNDLPVASRIPATHLKPPSPGHAQALSSRVFHLNRNIIGQSLPRSLADNAVPSRSLGQFATLGTDFSALVSNQGQASSTIALTQDSCLSCFAQFMEGFVAPHSGQVLREPLLMD